MAKVRIKVMNRRSDNGQLVSALFATLHPLTTVTERRKVLVRVKSK